MPRLILLELQICPANSSATMDIRMLQYRLQPKRPHPTHPSVTKISLKRKRSTIAFAPQVAAAGPEAAFIPASTRPSRAVRALIQAYEVSHSSEAPLTRPSKCVDPVDSSSQRYYYTPVT